MVLRRRTGLEEERLIAGWVRFVRESLNCTLMSSTAVKQTTPVVKLTRRR
jgi:hypothetical protein